MRGLDLFAGIGGASIAMQRAGMEVAAHAEIEPFPCRVLQHRFPAVPNLGDVAKITTEDLKALGRIHVVSFGSPCQDWSVAGKRLGLKGHRSSLFHEAIRIIRLCEPRFAVFENVPGLFSSAGGWDFASVLDEMAESGALDIAWRVLDAQWFGVPQRRRRIFLVADFRGERGGEILSISQGVFRHPAPGREAGEEVAATVSASPPSQRKGGSGRDYVAEVAPDSRSNYHSDHDGDENRLISEVAGTLGGGAGQRGWADDTDRMTFIPELAGGQPTRYGKGANSSVDDGALVPSIYQEAEYGIEEDDSAGSLRAGRIPEHQMVRTSMAVRRLTPTECERLQGFPDGWTDIPGASDSARYRALGNAWAVPVGEWVMRGITETRSA